MKDEEVQAVVRRYDEEMQWQEDVYAELSAVPPPMIENNWDLDSECLTGEALREAAVPELTAVRRTLCIPPHFPVLLSLLPGLTVVQVCAPQTLLPGK